MRALRLTAATLLLAATFSATAPQQPAGAVQYLALSGLRVSGPYTGRAPDGCGGFICPGPTPLTSAGTISADVGCVIIWCIGTVRVQTTDPTDPSRSLNLGGIGFGYPQICDEGPRGIQIALHMNTLVTTPSPPFLRIDQQSLGLWISGTEAGKLSFKGSVPQVGETRLPWQAFGTIPLAQVHASTFPFNFGLLCL